MRALVGFGVIVGLMLGWSTPARAEWPSASVDVGGGMHGFDGVMSPMRTWRFAIRFPLGIYIAYADERGAVWSDAPMRGDGAVRDQVVATSIVLGVRRSMGVVSFSGDAGLGQHLFYADANDLDGQARGPRNNIVVLHGTIDLWLTRYTTIGGQIGAALVGEREQMFAITAGLQLGVGNTQRAVFALPWEQRSGARDLR